MWTSPEPESEFREEAEFRSRVYHMLSIGLSTTEIEGLFRKRIDWTLYDAEVVKNLQESSGNKIMISLPDSMFSGLDKNAQALKKMADINNSLVDSILLLQSNMDSNFKKIVPDVTSSLIGVGFIAGVAIGIMGTLFLVKIL